MSSSFTFVNVSNAPGLGPQETKQMRGHVTKANFAKRRQRLAKAFRDKSVTPTDPVCPNSDSERRMVPVLKDRFPTLDPNCDKLLTVDSTYSSIGFLLSKFRPYSFGEDGIGGSSRKAEWVNLVRSEPALVEASVSIALQHCPGPTNTRSLQRAVLHKGRAIQMINRKLGTPSGLADGLLSAVFTLTYAEVSTADT
ncbi:hypothetical protein NW752_001515 [Fusarium irregulare]|uniref:Uncharacterized protein n=1 Tax=Fusarium irregulare TaxID=2494466 RepID=A0A9W8PT51_9HYPO|nr:hypothetical protein NW766_003675 [Fusarium irregulare]KAJ4026565.1 hypothetical protein NW752_001515 [Fusarium irregulare]